MVASIKSRALAVLLGIALAGSGWLYWQRLTSQRDAAVADAERQRDVVASLQFEQARQRQQLDTLHAALAQRELALAAVERDMRAARVQLDQLGEQDAETRDWLDDGLPGGVADWLRQLQHGADDDANAVPLGARLPDQPAARASADTR